MDLWLFDPTLDPLNPDLNLIIHKTQALTWNDLSRQLEVDPVKAKQKALISLVGRLVSKKQQYKPAIREAIYYAWKFAYNFHIKDVDPSSEKKNDIDPNNFLFHFGHLLVRLRVLQAH